MNKAQTMADTVAKAFQALDSIIGSRRKSKACNYINNAGTAAGAKRRLREKEYRDEVIKRPLPLYKTCMIMQVVA